MITSYLSNVFLGFLIYSTLLHKSIYYQMDLSNTEINKSYEFSAFPILKDYIVAFEIVSYSGCSGYESGPWPRNTNDAYLLVNDLNTDKDVTKVFEDKRSYIAFNCWGDRGINHFDFGKLIYVKNPFKKLHFQYKIKTVPPEYIKSIYLKLEYGGYEEFWAGSPLLHIMNVLIIYGALLGYLLVSFIHKIINPHKKPKK